MSKQKTSLLKKFILFLLVYLLLGVVVSFSAFVYIAKDLPDPSNLSNRDIIQSTKIYDRTGEILLYEVHGEEKRTVIKLDGIPDYVKNATIAIEDKDFYNHGGISIWGLLRGIVWQAVQGKKIQGGSTLSQQFIKNALLSSERTITRKIKEAILAIELERRYSKDEILEMYLNEIPYGGNAYGIEAAAETYFNKQAKDLTLAEAAILAAIPQAATYYSPYGSHPEDLKTRQKIVLQNMADQGFITQAEADAAKIEEMKYAQNIANIKAPHFVMYVKEYLVEKYGEEMVENGGLKVITTLDLDKQTIAEETVKVEAEKLVKQKANNAALTAIDPKTGQILAMVGSKDYFDLENDGNVNVCIRDNQPGSSFKPFAYLEAFIKGYTPETILFDLRTDFNNYTPKNFDGTFRGPVSMRSALAMSLNIPAVKTLYLAGLNNTINLAEDLGITTLKDRSRYGLSLVLGGGDVTLLEMVSAYGVFANEGIRVEPSSILKVEDSAGKILEEYTKKEKRVVDANYVRLLTDILSDNEARIPVFGRSNNLMLKNRPAAAKTGTTNENKDAWTIGYTPQLVTGIWVGNNDNASMNSVAGASGAAPIWNKFMNAALKDAPVESFNKPKQVITNKSVLSGKEANERTVKVDTISGLLATDLTPPNLIEERTYSEIHCILYYVDKNNPQGPYPSNPYKDPQFKNWEAPVQEWLKKQQAQGLNIYNEAPPTEYDNIHTLGNKPSIEIIEPSNNDYIVSNSFNISVNVVSNSDFPIKQVDYFIDDNLVLTSTNSPFSGIIKINDEINNSDHKLTAKAYDTVFNSNEHSISFITKTEDNSGPQINFYMINTNLNEENFPLTLNATVTDKKSGVKNVEFYYQELGTTNQQFFASSPLAIENTDQYQVMWGNKPSAGIYEVFVIATDYSNNTTKSNKISVNIYGVNYSF